MTRNYPSSSSASMTPAALTKYTALWDEICAMKLRFRKFKAPLLSTEHKTEHKMRLTHARVKSLVAVDKKGEVVGQQYSSPITNPKYGAMFLIYIEMSGYPGRGVDIITDGIKYKFSYRTAKSHVFMPNPQLANVKLTTADKHKLDEAIALWETEGDWVQPQRSSMSSISSQCCSNSCSCSRSKNSKKFRHSHPPHPPHAKQKSRSAHYKIGP